MRKSHENLGERLVGHLIGAVVNNDTETESSSQIFGSLGLTGTGRASGGGSHEEIERLGQGNVTPISQGGDNETSTIADILVTVPSQPIANSNNAIVVLLLGIVLVHGVLVHAELKLTGPQKVSGIHNLFGYALVNNITSMHIDSNDGNDLDTHLHRHV